MATRLRKTRRLRGGRHMGWGQVGSTSRKWSQRWSWNYRYDETPLQYFAKRRPRPLWP